MCRTNLFSFLADPQLISAADQREGFHRNWFKGAFSQQFPSTRNRKTFPLSRAIICTINRSARKSVRAGGQRNLNSRISCAGGESGRRERKIKTSAAVIKVDDSASLSSGSQLCRMPRFLFSRKKFAAMDINKADLHAPVSPQVQLAGCCFLARRWLLFLARR